MITGYTKTSKRILNMLSKDNLTINQMKQRLKINQFELLIILKKMEHMNHLRINWGCYKINCEELPYIFSCYYQINSDTHDITFDITDKGKELILNE